MTVLPEQREGLLALVAKWRDETEVVGLDAYYTDGMRACADELESALSSPSGAEAQPVEAEAQAVAAKDALHDMNAALCDFSMRWELDGDYLRCAECNRPHIASAIDEAFRHQDGCARAASETHPWRTLLRILRPLYTRPQPVAAAGQAGEETDWRTLALDAANALQAERLTTDALREALGALTQAVYPMLVPKPQFQMIKTGEHERSVDPFPLIKIRMEDLRDLRQAQEAATSFLTRTPEAQHDK